MTRSIWEFLDEKGHGIIKRWLITQNVTPKEQAKFDFALNQLRALDFGLVSRSLLAGPLRGSKGIYKLRLRCRNRELRPMLCRSSYGEYTLLYGAIEIGDQLQPPDAVERAEGNREELMKNPHRRALY